MRRRDDYYNIKEEAEQANYTHNVEPAHRHILINHIRSICVIETRHTI